MLTGVDRPNQDYLPAPPPIEPPTGPEPVVALPVLLLPEVELPFPIPVLLAPEEGVPGRAEPLLCIVPLPFNVPLVPVLPLLFMVPMLPLVPLDVPEPTPVPLLVWASDMLEHRTESPKADAKIIRSDMLFPFPFLRS